MASGTVKVDAEKLAEAKRALSEIKNGIETALMRSINRALSTANTEAARGIAAEVNLTQKVIKQNFSLTQAAISRLTGKFRSSGRPVPLINYGARQTNTGVSVQVKKARPRKVLPYTFLATMGSGHQGVFQRKRHRGEGKPIGNTAKLFMNFPANWPKQYRLPIEEMFGPRVEDILSNDPVLNPVLDEAGKTINERLEHETEYILEKARNA